MGLLINNLLCLLRGIFRCRQLCMVYPDVVIGQDVTVMPFAVLGRPPQYCGPSYLDHAAVALHLIIGEGCVIGSGAVLYRGAHIESNVMVGDHACIREDAIIRYRSKIAQQVTVNRGAVVGPRTRIMDGAHLTGNMTIGADCFIGMHVSFANDNAMGADDHIRKRDSYRGATVGDRVRIGHGARIHPGITLNDDAIVGAGSVVTRDVGPKQRVMGEQARRK